MPQLESPPKQFERVRTQLSNLSTEMAVPPANFVLFPTRVQRVDSSENTLLNRIMITLTSFDDRIGEMSVCNPLPRIPKIVALSV